MRTSLVAVLFVVLVGAVSAAESSAAADSSKDGSGLKPGFYIEPGVSALIFTGPERSLPIVEMSPPTFRRLLGPVEEKDVVPAVRLALGFVFEDTPSWLGKDFRVEASTNFWWVDAEETQTLPDVPHGRAVLYDRTRPDRARDYALILLSPLDGVVRREGEYRYVDGNLGFKTDYVASDLISFTPAVAFTYATLDYDASVISRGVIETYRLKERLDTDYVGATIGLDLNLKPFKRFTFTIGGSVSPLWSSTDSKVTNSWNNTLNPNFGLRFGFDDEDDEFTFRATGTGSVAYQPLSWFKVTAFGGVEYWDKVARTDFPVTPIGQSPWAPNAGFPKIGYGSMTNFRAGLNFTFIIGK